MAGVGAVRLSEVLEGLVAPGLGLGRRSVGLVEGALGRWSAKFVVGVLEVEADENEVQTVRSWAFLVQSVLLAQKTSPAPGASVREEKPLRAFPYLYLIKWLIPQE